MAPDGDVEVDEECHEDDMDAENQGAHGHVGDVECWSWVSFRLWIGPSKKVTDICLIDPVACGRYCKSFTIVIYAHKDNGLYYKIMIVANLALARSVNYDRKVRCKLKRTFMIVNYDPKRL